MRLEEDEQAAALSVPQRVQGRGDLSRMVGVVVVDVDTSGLAAMFEPARRAAKLCQHACGFLTAHSGELERCERGRRVAPVVVARNRQRSVVRSELLSAHVCRDFCEPVLEKLGDFCVRAECRVMVEVDVRQDGDARAQLGDRPVGLVSLHDQPSLSGPGVPAELRHVGADQPARVAAELLQREGDHGARRRLAVRPCDHDRVSQRDELGEQLGTGLPGDASRERRRRERLPTLRRLRRLVRDLDVDPLELLEVRGMHSVPAAHLRPPRPREQRVRAHARPADTGDPESASVKRRGQ